jgi:hypothetical protein
VGDKRGDKKGKEGRNSRNGTEKRERERERERERAREKKENRKRKKRGGSGNASIVPAESSSMSRFWEERICFT